MVDYIEKMGLKKVINASGKMTILGVSKVSDEVATVQKIAGQNFFIMDELMAQSGAYLAKLLNVEDAQIVASASAGIVQCVAAVIGGGSMTHLYHPYDPRIKENREIVIPKGHNIDYGTPIELMITQGGGVLCEAGYGNICTAEHMRQKMTDQTAAILYVKSHHTVQKGMLSVEEVVELAKEYQLPLIIDAAAEEDLFRYTQAGADLVIYSGAKALEGPSSGLVIGKKKYIQWVRLQSKGIGRSMKIGKENIFGLVQATQQYVEIGPETGEVMLRRLEPFIEKLNTIEGITANITQDVVRKNIYRGSVKIHKEIIQKVIEAQQSGDPAIYTRNYQAHDGIIEYDIRSVNDDEMNQIVTRLREIMENLAPKNETP